MGWNYLSIPKLQRFHKLQRWNRWSLGMDKYIHPTLYQACDFLSMLEFKLIHVRKRGPWLPWYFILVEPHGLYFGNQRGRIGALHRLSSVIESRCVLYGMQVVYATCEKQRNRWCPTYSKADLMSRHAISVTSIWFHHSSYYNCTLTVYWI